MTAWSQIQRAPARTLPLPPEAFSDSFRGRPSKPVHVGLRTIAMLDLAEARQNAAQVAVAAFPEDRDAALAVDTYNDELIAWIASRCVCELDDTRKDWLLLEGTGVEGVKNVLSPAGARLIFDAYERLNIDHDPTQPEATDDEIVRLGEVYADAAPHLAGDRLSRVRRLLSFVLDELRAVIPEANDDDG